MISQKKILIITTTDSMIGQFLLPHIKHLQDNGNIVECACHKTGFWFEDMVKSGIKVHEIPFARNPLKSTNLTAKKQLYKLCEENKYDLIHCHTPVGGVMGRLAGKKFNIPVLYIAHGFHFYEGAPLLNTLVYKNIEKHYSKYTNALVVMNEEDYSAAKKMNAKKVYKINGIGFCNANFKDNSKKEELIKELGIGKEDKVLLSVGELNVNKNHIEILNALNEIKDKPFKYFICGRGPLNEKYEEFIYDNGLENKVKLLGFRKDINDILNLTDIFIMPSLREGLPMSMMEAMEKGIPVIASNIRGCKDLIIDGVNGLLVDLEEENGFKDAICKLLDNEDLRKEMGENNKVKIKEYYIENVLKQMEPIYDEIFN